MQASPFAHCSLIGSVQICPLYARRIRDRSAKMRSITIADRVDRSSACERQQIARTQP
ncbi:hypothetical protein [Chamaesiphon minutus]|uniref:hypothetical protein n=1 Tax=Chamaesiphon minutus TaxID=1173032 RepID=UPI0002EBB951|nr:hypothetical protein [Chamaesiphon minutus]